MVYSHRVVDSLAIAASSSCQRNVSAQRPRLKLGRCIKELERLYGIQNGGDRGNQYKVAEPNNSALAKSQSDLATQMGISVDTLQNYKMLAELIEAMVHS